jgi:phage terminase large subunit-like protein
MKSFKEYITEMGAGAVGGGSAGPTNVTAGITTPQGDNAVGRRKKKKYDPRMMGMGKRKDF